MVINVVAEALKRQEQIITDGAGEQIKVIHERGESRFALIRTDRIHSGATVIILNRREALELAAFIYKEVPHV